jgi:hypothetical protein
LTKSGLIFLRSWLMGAGILILVDTNQFRMSRIRRWRTHYRLIGL